MDVDTEAREQQVATMRRVPILTYRDGSGTERIASLGGRSRLTLGSRSDNDVMLGWDQHVSRLQAQLKLVGGEWIVEDAGVSKNGTFLNGARVCGRQILRDGDVLLVGATVLGYSIRE